MNGDDRRPGGTEAFDRVAGTVTSFDDPRGIGVVTTSDGTELGFHCTAIADGTRTIAVGASVTARVVAGRLGRWEAADIRPG